MRRVNLNLAFGLAGLIFNFFSLVGTCNGEPVYEGKPESYWISTFATQVKLTERHPISALGTNALKVALKAVEYRSGTNAATIRTNAAMLIQKELGADVLIPLARKNFDPQVRAWALNGLTFNGSKEVTTLLVESLKDKDPLVRRTAMFGLCLGQREKIPEEMKALLKCLTDPDPNVRSYAAGILCNYYSPPSGENQGAVDKAAVEEIKRAANDADANIKSAATAALKEQHPQKIFRKFAYELALAFSEINGNSWTATITVTDESQKPIEGAKVIVTYYVPIIPGDRRKIEGETDAQGIFKATHKDSSRQLDFKAEKPEYYPTSGGHEFYFPQQYDEARMVSNRNPNVTLVLKKRIN